MMSEDPCCKSQQHAGGPAVTLNFTPCLWFWLLYSINKIQVKDGVIYSAWFSVQVQTFTAPLSFSFVSEQYFPKIKLTWFFCISPYWKCFQRPATPFQPGAVVAFWASVWSASFFPVQAESHGRKLCLPSWEPQSESPVKSQGHRDTCLVFLFLSGLNVPGTR